MRCLIVDDDPSDRELVERLVSRAGHVPYTVADGEAAVAIARSEPFDVMLVDLGMVGMDGVACIRAIREALPEQAVLVVSAYDDQRHVLDAVAAGADGYVLKSEIDDQLARAIDEVMTGGGPMSAKIARFVLDKLRRDSAAPRPGGKDERALSRRENEVLDGLSRGHTYAQIASTLDISVNTVRHHIRNLYDKLQVSDKAQAVTRAMEATKRR